MDNTEALQEAIEGLKKVRWRAVLDGFESPDELAVWMDSIHSTADETLKKIESMGHKVE